MAPKDKEKYTIMVVEDDEDIREGIRILMGGGGYTVTEAGSGEEALEQMNEDTDLVILDIKLPGISGLKVCDEIRKVSAVPVLILTAKGQESDKTIGFMAGADDYLVKPFSYAELDARVKALLRRYYIYRGKGQTAESAGIEEASTESAIAGMTDGTEDLKGTESPNKTGKPGRAQTQKSAEISKVKETVLASGRIRVAPDIERIWKDGKEIKLTSTEYRIFRLLFNDPAQTFSVRNIYESVWNEPYTYNANNTVMVHIRNLRAKIEDDPQEPAFIRNIWGKGYRYERGEK